MRLGGRALAGGAIAVLLLALPASAFTLTVDSAGATHVVNGITQVSAAGVGEGNYLVLRVGGRFLAAVSAPFAYEWDTRGLDDGSARIEATEVGTSGPVGSAVGVDVMVANAVQVTTPVTLKWGVKAGDVIGTSIGGTCDVVDSARPDTPHKYVPGRLYKALAGTMTGAASDTVRDATAERVGVERSLDRLVVQYLAQNTELAGSGRKASFQVLATGKIQDTAQAGTSQARAGLPWVVLPKDPVDVRATWTGDLVCMDSAQTGAVHAAPDATYELLGFRMWGGEKCALIEARARYAEDFTVVFAGDTEPFPKANALVRRLAWFSLDTGRVLRVEETVERYLSIKTADWGVTADSFVDKEPAATTGAGGRLTGGPGSAIGGGEAAAGGGRPMMGGGLMGGGATGTTQPTTAPEKIPTNVDLIYRISLVVGLTK